MTDPLAMPAKHSSRRDFPGRRWLIVVLRAVHLVGVVLLGAALLGQGDTGWAAGVTLASGLGMLICDLWANSSLLAETAGFGMLLKLALVGLMVVFPPLALPLFWAILVASGLLSHAPASFRHRRLFAQSKPSNN